MVEITVKFWARRVLEVAAALETKGLTLDDSRTLGIYYSINAYLVHFPSQIKKRTNQK